MVLSAAFFPNNSLTRARARKCQANRSNGCDGNGGPHEPEGVADGHPKMRELAITIPSAINPIPTMTISASMVSRKGICFDCFMVLRLFGPGTWWTVKAKAEVRKVTQPQHRAGGGAGKGRRGPALNDCD